MRTARLSPALLLAAVVLTPTVALSEEDAPPTTPAKRPDCSGAEHRAFDFWLGSWRVTQGEQLAGHNSIRSSLDGCVLREEWRGARGTTGSSLNVYNRATKQWQQFWVDNQGGVLELTGNVNAEGAMVMTGESGGVRQRITWSRLDDGSVRQLWEQSSDSGKTWNGVFDGLYRRETESGGAATDAD